MTHRLHPNTGLDALTDNLLPGRRISYCPSTIDNFNYNNKYGKCNGKNSFGLNNKPHSGNQAQTNNQANTVHNPFKNWTFTHDSSVTSDSYRIAP